MTTKFSTIKFALSNFYCRGASHAETAFVDAYPLCPQGPPPSKSQILFLLSSRRLWLKAQYGIAVSCLRHCAISGFAMAIAITNRRYHVILEAQQRYFSYRAIFVAIVSQDSLVLVLMGYRTIITWCIAKRGIAQMCLCEAKYQGGVSHYFGKVITSQKIYRAIWDIAAIVSQHRAIWGH